jgi:hypothetical protein
MATTKLLLISEWVYSTQMLLPIPGPTTEMSVNPAYTRMMAPVPDRRRAIQWPVHAVLMQRVPASATLWGISVGWTAKTHASSPCGVEQSASG